MLRVVLCVLNDETTDVALFDIVTVENKKQGVKI